ncbi:MAG: 16S rRNA (adenine(1518)-N(6)/adenine(1519)-N(6))-dimethyltransferase RsmA [Myxococcota bacterium]
MTFETPHDLVRAYQAGMKKRFGQHFLSDPSILARIVDIADVTRGDHVLEIGPGCGTLTWEMMQRGAHVHAIEIDPDAAAFLGATFGADERLTLHHADALTVDLDAVLGAHDGAWKVVSNLPYNVATPIFFRLSERAERFDALALMYQREVAQRMVARPGGPQYGALALMAALDFEATLEMTLPPGAFFPPPKVHSAVVRYVPIPGGRIPDAAVRARFRQLVRAAFQQRRKTLPNGLKSAGVDKAAARAAMESVGLDVRARAETLSFEQFLGLARALLE